MVILSGVLANTVVASPLDNYRWDKRILIVFADELENDHLIQVSQLLANAECALQDRDILVSWIYPGGEGRVGDLTLSAQEVLELRNQFRLSRSSNLTAALVGKDGGIKAHYEAWPALGEVFALIDGMPMRRAEMHADAADCDWVESRGEKG